MIDDFLIQFCQKLRDKDFVVKTEDLTRKKKGKRQYLSNKLTREITKELNHFFESYVKVPRIKVGKKQSIETLINEEAVLFSRHLRNEKDSWTPRINLP